MICFARLLSPFLILGLAFPAPPAYGMRQMMDRAGLEEEIEESLVPGQAQPVPTHTRRAWLRQTGWGTLGLVAAPDIIFGAQRESEGTSPTALLDRYIDTLHSLSTGSWESVGPVYTGTTDQNLHLVYERIKGLGGTGLGVSFQQNFSMQLQGEFERYVIVDINPMVTEVMVPLFGHLMARKEEWRKKLWPEGEAVGPRRLLLSILLGMPLTEKDVQALLNPTPVADQTVKEYLEASLRRIVARRPIEERRRWYREVILDVVDKEIFPRLRRLGRLERLPPDKAKLPRRVLDQFLNPDLLFSEESDVNGNFVKFLEEHAEASWKGYPKATWLSSDGNCLGFERSWAEGRFIGMTADLTDLQAMKKLGEYLRSKGSPAVSLYYPSNVGEYVGFQLAKRMHTEVLAPLDPGGNLLTVVSHGPVLKTRILPNRAAVWFYRYVPGNRFRVTTNDFEIGDRLLDGIQTVTGKGEEIHGRFLAGLRGFLQGNSAFYRENQDRDKLSPEGEEEYQRYVRLVEHLRASAAQVATLEPDAFVDWVREWSRKNEPGLVLETEYFRALVWNLADAGVIRPWPDDYPWDERPRGPQTSPEIAAENLDDLRSTHPYVRRRAALILERLGPAAKGAIHDLMKIVGDVKEVPFIRRDATRALGSIGGEAKEVVPALEKIAEEEKDKRLEFEIREAIKRIQKSAGMEETEWMTAGEFGERNWAHLHLSDAVRQRLEYLMGRGDVDAADIPLSGPISLFVQGDEVYWRVVDNLLPRTPPEVVIQPTCLPRPLPEDFLWKEPGMILWHRKMYEAPPNPLDLKVVETIPEEVEKLDPVHLVLEIFRKRLGIPESNYLGGLIYRNAQGQDRVVLFTSA